MFGKGGVQNGYTVNWSTMERNNVFEQEELIRHGFLQMHELQKLLQFCILGFLHALNN